MKKASKKLLKSRHVKREKDQGIGNGTIDLIKCPFCPDHEIEPEKSLDEDGDYKTKINQYCRNIRKSFKLE